MSYKTSYTNSLKVDTIQELVTNDGVSIESIILKDNILSSVFATNFTPQASNPGGANTLWQRSSDSHLLRGAVDLEEAGTGDVVGPASATDNAIPRYNGTTGKLLQNTSGFTCSDTFAVNTTGSLTAGTTITATGSVITNTISERTAANGVSIDNVNLKDGSINMTTAAANPGGANTVWQRTSDGHILRGAVDLENGGDVVGPATATDNAIPRYNGITGKLIQDSVGFTCSDTFDVTIDGNIAGAQNITSGASINAGTALTAGASITAGGNITANGVVITNTVSERTATNGVTIDGVNLKDGSINMTTAATNPGGANTVWQRTSDGHVLRGAIDLENTGGDVFGPASATDNAIARFDLTTGKLLQNTSGFTCSDAFAVSTTGSLSAGTTVSVGTNLTVGGNATITGNAIVNTISERTAANGVTVDGVNLKDGSINMTTAAANPGGANTVWQRTSDGKIFRGTVDLEKQGDVVGPNGTNTGNNGLVVYDGNTGKLIKEVITVAIKGDLNEGLSIGSLQTISTQSVNFGDRSGNPSALRATTFGHKVGGNNIGSNNVFIGRQIANVTLSTGDMNVVLGDTSGELPGASTNNVILGSTSCTDDTNVLTNCIVLGNTLEPSGGNDGVIQIGKTGIGYQSSCYIGGIVGVSPTSSDSVVVINSSDQLGSITKTNLRNDYKITTTAISPYVVLADDELIIDNFAGPGTITLPAATTKRIIKIVVPTGATNQITVNAAGGDNINGAPSTLINTNYGAITLMSNGTTGWYIF